MVERSGFEPPNPLGADLQSAAFGHFATSPLHGADYRNRTYNLLITNQLLCLVELSRLLYTYQRLFILTQKKNDFNINLKNFEAAADV